LSISLITTRGRPSSARQKRSKAAASLAGLASSRQTRSGSSSRPGGARIPADRSDHVKALAAARAALDSQLGAVDDQHLRPPLGQQPRAQGLGEDIDPVRDQLAVPRGIPALRGAGQAHGRQPAGVAASGERRVAIGGPARHQRQRVTDLAGGELVTPRARLALPRLYLRRALKTEPARRRLSVLLARQRRREAVRRITVPRLAPPPLAPMRRLPIPATTDYLAAHMRRIRAPRDLHLPEWSRPHATS
jgi:hypothetical protein